MITMIRHIAGIANDVVANLKARIFSITLMLEHP
jgi:hypothetical protein